jgi:hypothetical protein
MSPALFAEHAQRIQIETEASTAQGFLEHSPVVEIRQNEGDGIAVFVFAERLESDETQAELVLVAGTPNGRLARELVGVRIVELPEEILVAGDIDVEVTGEAPADLEVPGGRQRTATRGVPESVIESEHPLQIETARGEAASVFAFEQRAPVRGQEGCEGRIAIRAAHVIVWQLDPRAEDLGPDELGHQKAACTLNCRIGDAQPG